MENLYLQKMDIAGFIPLADIVVKYFFELRKHSCVEKEFYWQALTSIILFKDNIILFQQQQDQMRKYSFFICYY